MTTARSPAGRSSSTTCAGAVVIATTVASRLPGGRLASTTTSTVVEPSCSDTPDAPYHGVPAVDAVGAPHRWKGDRDRELLSAEGLELPRSRFHDVPPPGRLRDLAAHRVALDGHVTMSIRPSASPGARAARCAATAVTAAPSEQRSSRDTGGSGGLSRGGTSSLAVAGRADPGPLALSAGCRKFRRPNLLARWVKESERG